MSSKIGVVMGRVHRCRQLCPLVKEVGSAKRAVGSHGRRQPRGVNSVAASEGIRRIYLPGYPGTRRPQILADNLLPKTN